MRLKSAQIKNFKRFVDLTIQNLPPDPKLIVLLGPNGCGKSSLFDAFQRKLKVDLFYGLSEESQRYYKRVIPETVAGSDSVELDFHDGTPISDDDFKRSLYIRSAYRHDPSFQSASISRQKSVLDRHAVRQMNDIDKTVQDNYNRTIWKILGKATQPGLTIDEIIKSTIGDLQKSMKTVFEDLHLDALVSAQDVGTFTFTKGASKNFLYENLSAGEKAAFDLLLDIVVNKAAFDNSLYCLDEPEAHLSTRLQGKLLNELYRLVPENSQLWLATHSIGMVRKALDIHSRRPEHVVFLDMGFSHDGKLRNYDKPQTVEPASPDRNFWLRHYTVALGDMAGFMAPDRIVLCEGSMEGDDSALDESCYKKIFAREFPGTLFISVGSATKVEKRMGDLLPLLERIVGKALVIRFRDRDALTDQEIEDKRSEGVSVMSGYRNIESMLLSDGVLLKLCDSVDKPDCFNAIKTDRDTALNRASGQNAPDDLKPAAQVVHQAARVKLQLPRPGETKTAFMRDVLAPLVTADTPEYKKLKADIFGP